MDASLSDDNLILLTAGPVSVDQSVLDTLAQPVIPHYGSRWMTFYRELLTNLQNVFQTTNDLYLVTGPGSSAIEMGISSVSDAGDTIIVVNNGYFGERLCILSEAHGLNVVEVIAPNVERVGAEHVQAALDKHPDAVAIAIVHHDTTTAVQNDIEAITKLAHEHGTLCIVDAVSSLGGINFPVDEWDVDICVTVANKCLGGVPGLAPISVSPRAWETIDSKQSRGWYLNLRTWRYYVEDEYWNSWHPYPTTVATSTAFALGTAVKAILDEGLAAVHKRYQQVAAQVRAGLRERGFEMLLPEEESSPVLTTVYGLRGMDIAHFSKWLLEEKRLMISGGLGDLAGKVFRVGHMGRAASPQVAERFLAAVDDYLDKHN